MPTSDTARRQTTIYLRGFITPEKPARLIVCPIAVDCKLCYSKETAGFSLPWALNKRSYEDFQGVCIGGTQISIWRLLWLIM